ncbi:hypothetical protein NC653_020579 [Populus alba x Populus x berolinensis]|uniref:Cytosolic endo-beta-N-acetylglucosaminidase TIM barrel domain-containing protein n=2 Tax=Populus alba x Populus x berolinensis TaxID=444605 RepID=A0AAD6QCS1_9ROSI|nr:hypothetical protein NC653_020579 [Populus alba x Populus x berolinensis]
MQGGSVNDMWVQGGTDPDAYATRHWYLIDVFVYFSHSLVTLSPPCWTNTAHRRGVKVFGTFITEWDEGRLVRNKLLATMKSAPMNAERLAELAVDLGFDGWLINMEVSLHKQQIPNLEEFVSHLTHAMHSLMPESLVIWYDSVITTGYIWCILPSTDKLDIVQGQGYRVSVEGNQLTDAPWNNMSCQGFQSPPPPFDLIFYEMDGVLETLPTVSNSMTDVVTLVLCSHAFY